MILLRLKLNEWIFLIAGISTLIAIPFFEIGGFYLWFTVKLIYLLGIIILVVENYVRH